MPRAMLVTLHACPVNLTEMFVFSHIAFLTCNLWFNRFTSACCTRACLSIDVGRSRAPKMQYRNPLSRSHNVEVEDYSYGT
jgi:hypothetical protein